VVVQEAAEESSIAGSVAVGYRDRGPPTGEVMMPPEVYSALTIADRHLRLAKVRARGFRASARKYLTSRMERP